jgi:hypothetical protein
MGQTRNSHYERERESAHRHTGIQTRHQERIRVAGMLNTDWNVRVVLGMHGIVVVSGLTDDTQCMFAPHSTNAVRADSFPRCAATCIGASPSGFRRFRLARPLADRQSLLIASPSLEDARLTKRLITSKSSGLSSAAPLPPSGCGGDAMARGGFDDEGCNGGLPKCAITGALVATTAPRCPPPPPTPLPVAM